MLRGCSPWPCEREGRTQEVPTSIFRLHLRHGQGLAVLEKNMVKLAETQLTDPGGGLDLKGRGKRGTETSFEFGRERRWWVWQWQLRKYTCDRIHTGAIKGYVTWPYGNNSFLYDNSLHAHLSTDLGLLVDKFHVLRVWDLAHSMCIMQKEKWGEEMKEWSSQVLPVGFLDPEVLQFRTSGAPLGVEASS